MELIAISNEIINQNFVIKTKEKLKLNIPVDLFKQNPILIDFTIDC